VEKDAFLGNLWEKFRDLFRTEDERSTRRVNFLLGEKKDPGRWASLPRNASSSGFVKALSSDSRADPKLKRHVTALHDLSKAPTVSKIDSSSKSGRTYEVKQLPGGKLGCTCNDWRFKGTVNPSHKCKHIKAFEQGLAKAAAFNAQTAAFFDEFSKIRDSKHTDRRNMRADRTSSLLEEPISDRVPPLIEDQDPEVSSRRFGKTAARMSKKEKRERAAKFTALGAISGPAVAGLSGVLRGGKKGFIRNITQGTSPKRWVPATMTTGALISGGIPAIRHQIERGILEKGRERRKKNAR